MKKFVHWMFGLAAIVAATLLIIGAFIYFGAQRAEQENADWFYEASRRAALQTPKWPGHAANAALSANQCVYGYYRDDNRHVKFVDNFNSCVRHAEGRIFGAPLPSATCIDTLPEKSRQQLVCILDAELPRAKALAEREDQWNREQEVARKAQEVKRAAEEAKKRAADKAIAPAIHRAIMALHPSTDTERRTAAIRVSCAYDDSKAGYRVSLSEYTKASQKGVDVTDRFDSGRYAICNQQQASNRVEQTEAVNRQTRDWAYYPPNR